MALPLVQSVFQPTNWDLFLDEIGFIHQSPESRLQLTDKLQQSVEYVLVEKIFRRLPTDRQMELVRRMKEADKSGDESEVNAFLAGEFPQIDELVREAIDQVKEDFRISASMIKDSMERQLQMVQEAEKLRSGKAKIDFGNPDAPLTPISTDSDTAQPETAKSDEPLPTETPAEETSSVPTPAVEDNPPPVDKTDTDQSVEPFPWETQQSASAGSGTSSSVDQTDESTDSSRLDIVEKVAQPVEPPLPPVFDNQTTSPSTQAEEPFPWEAAANDAANLSVSDDKPADADDNKSNPIDDELKAIGSQISLKY